LKYSITDAVFDVLAELYFLRLAFKYNLVNYSALARHIQPLVSRKLGKPVGLAAIIIAVQRYSKQLEKEKVDNALFAALAECKVALRTDLVAIHFSRSPELYSALTKAINKTNWFAGERVYLIQRSREITVVADPRFHKTFASLASDKREVLNTAEHLALVTVNFSPRALYTAGMIAFLAAQLEKSNINIQIIFSTHSALSFVVDEKDAAMAYEKLVSVLEGAKMAYQEFK